MGFDTDLTACARIVERGDPLRFRVAMAAPVSARRILFPLFAFNVEVARAPWVTQEPMIAEMRLQWWRDVCDEIAEARPVRRHEVATPLADVLPAGLAGVLDRLVAARRWDIYRDAFEDAAHFERYIDETAGGLMWISASLLGAADEKVVRDAAFASGVVAFFRAIPALEAAGRVPLIDGTGAGVRQLAETAYGRLMQARSLRGRVSAAARPALAGIAGTGQMLKAVMAHPELVSEERLPDVGLRFSLRAVSGRW